MLIQVCQLNSLNNVNTISQGPRLWQTALRVGKDSLMAGSEEFSDVVYYIEVDLET